jgi:NADH-quinone oxidoreductase subunit N
VAVETMTELPNLTPAIPEILLAAAALTLLLYGAFRGDSSTRTVSWATVVVMGLAAVFIVSGPSDGVHTFAGMFVADGFGVFMKLLILLGSALTIILSLGYIRDHGMERFEYPILILLATLGMMMMVAASDLISLYVGLELQSLSLYVLAAFRRDSERSTEAGLKYFVLGALASGILLYGASLIYGFTGSTNFEAIAANIAAQENGASVGVLFGLAFLTAGLAFKVAAVPFHMWTPDVYEGAPTPVTAFFSVAPKIAAFALLVRVMMGPFGGLAADWSQIVIVLSATSMVLGAFAAIGQRNIKRMMAYSSIGHVGFALMGLAAATPQGIQGLILYMTLYLAMNIGAWAIILNMRRGSGLVERIDDLAGMAKNQPMLAAAMAIFMFSLAGIPPLAGFFAKFYVLLAALDAGLYTLAVIGVLSAVVGSFYYLRIIKLMYFDEPAEKFSAPTREVGVIITVAAVFTLLFFLFPAPFVAEAELAANALFR